MSDYFYDVRQFMSGVIPSLSPKEVASALERLGFTCHRQRGIHKIYVKDDHQVTVPFQTKDLKKGTLHQIVKDNERKIVFITKQ